MHNQTTAEAEVGAAPPIAAPATLQDAEAGIATTAEKNTSTRDDSEGADQRLLEPSSCFTGHQLFYVFGLDGLGGMILSAGVNFAIAYAMYTTQDTVKHPIRLFQLPNTLAGDAAVTTFVQCILTWFVELGLVGFDLRQRSVQPIGFFPEPKRPWLRWLFMVPALAGDAEAPPAEEKVTRFAGVASFFQNALRGFFLAVLGFLFLWPIGVGALTALGHKQGGDYTYSDRWVPQAFKAIHGGLLGLFTTPPMAMFWLVKAGWAARHRTNVS
ncbi:hypothetical protein HJFPF1_09980 [Paramyrothecium foliicola]|nr:hypothetical protein HJFPF1_09980 [Paramyrothecium foliicola]